MTLRAPFPWFGGKSGIAAEIWERFGNVPNYVDPFAGSLAVPLARPHTPKLETVNDADGLLVNFWRAVSADPEAVARWCDWPVSETDLHPRHVHLVAIRAELSERLMGDPEYYDAKLAGWWVWGQCAWIGHGWCSGKGPWGIDGGRLIKGNAGQGINRQIPHLGNAGQGINRDNQPTIKWLAAIQARTRRMRITCGDWRRVLTPVVTHRHGMTGVLLDPPYTRGNMSYSGGDSLGDDVVEWCKENGGNKLLRIALCGHAGDYTLDGWTEHAWKANGGYGNQGGEDAEDNRHKEVVWFSPACRDRRQSSLFRATA